MMAGEVYLLPFSQVDDQELQDEIYDLNFNMDQVDIINQLTSLQNVQNSSLISNELLGYLDKLYSSLHQSKLDYSLLVDSDPDVYILNKHNDILYQSSRFYVESSFRKSFSKTSKVFSILNLNIRSMP